MADKKSFDERLFDALAEMENPVKDSTANVGKFSYSYATLDNVMRIVKSVLGRHGLFVRQSCEKDGDGWILRTYVFDPSESRLMDERPLIFGSDSQRNGIVETYARRYALNCSMGLAPVDTDAIETRGATQTTPELRQNIERGIAFNKKCGVDTDGILADFAGWEVDMRIAQNLDLALQASYKSAKKVQTAFPGTEIKEV